VSDNRPIIKYRPGYAGGRARETRKAPVGPAAFQRPIMPELQMVDLIEAFWRDRGGFKPVKVTISESGVLSSNMLNGWPT
jgi:hypothetical protein